MNSISTTTIFLFAILFCCAGVSTNAIYATGGLDDEEEEEAIEQLQTTVEDIQNTLGTIQLNLTSGANDITANCPQTEVVAEENTTTVTPPVEPPIQCPFVPVEENVTEVIEEIIENVTEPQQCPFTPPQEGIIPGIVLPNITEPVEPEPQCPPQEPPAVIEEPEPAVPECPLLPPPQSNTTETNGNNLTDGQEVATIEFDAQCSCFVVNKTPEEVSQ